MLFSKPDDHPDQLVDRARSGDVSALRSLYDQLAPDLARYARGQGIDDPEALANETMFRSFSNLITFTGDAGGFRSWVFTIAHNLIVDEHRRSARRPRTIDDGESTISLLVARESTEQLVIGHVAAERLADALDSLTPPQRDVVLLRVVADLSIADVAAITGLRPGAVKALQHRGTAALRRFLTTAVSDHDSETFTST